MEHPASHPALSASQSAVVEAMYKRNQWRMKPHDGLSEDDAAVKIQSGFRGKKSRRRCVKIARQKNQDYEDPECEAAAIKLQSGARGRKSRKRAAKIAHAAEIGRHAPSMATASSTARLRVAPMATLRARQPSLLVRLLA